MRLFLFGTLLWPDLLTCVAGRQIATSPASLPGHCVRRAPDGDWPMLVAGAGEAQGVLTEPLEPEVLARIDWYEGGYDCARAPVDLGAETFAYRSTGEGAEPWTLAAWQPEHGARTLLAAPEIMRAMGRGTPERLAWRRGIIHARAAARLAVSGWDRPTTVSAGLTLSDVRVEDVSHVYEAFNNVQEIRYSHTRFDGGTNTGVVRDATVVSHAATLLPYDPVRDRVLVVEQIRAAAIALGDPRPWMLEPVAGMIDVGETPEQAALREAQEEAGLALPSDALRFVARYYPSPGGLAQVLYSYVAICDLPDDAAKLGGLGSEAEDIRGHLVPLRDLIAMVESGEAANAPLILSAQWIALKASELRKG